jgi:hypothetical protein
MLSASFLIKISRSTTLSRGRFVFHTLCDDFTELYVLYGDTVAAKDLELISEEILQHCLKRL